MQTLAMKGGQFAVSLQNSAPSISGNDAVEFKVAAHVGNEPKPLAKVASGGELSRISLAIAVIASTANATPTLIFDEVDSGVGGAVAEVVGQLMRRLGRDRQVLAVTHLPQVAAQAHWQFQVEKRTISGSTLTSISQLSDSQRVDELARMLGGKKLTDTTRQHASEMLATASTR
jgi:DNA repair protein RecN (Recombination protein N)